MKMWSDEGREAILASVQRQEGTRRWREGTWSVWLRTMASFSRHVAYEARLFEDQLPPDWIDFIEALDRFAPGSSIVQRQEWRERS